MSKAQVEVAHGIGGVMKEGNVKVVVISQQLEINVEDEVALVPNAPHVVMPRS